jgi:hypothetical protein
MFPGVRRVILVKAFFKNPQKQVFRPGAPKMAPARALKKKPKVAMRNKTRIEVKKIKIFYLGT